MSKDQLLTAIRVAFVIAVALVAAFSLLPQWAMPQLDASDKLEHFLAYAFLAVLGALSFKGRRSVLCLLLLLPAFGIVIELLQKFSPGRTPEITDVAANTFGVAAGLVIATAIRFAIRR